MGKWVTWFCIFAWPTELFQCFLSFFVNQHFLVSTWYFLKQFKKKQGDTAGCVWVIFGSPISSPYCCHIHRLSLVWFHSSSFFLSRIRNLQPSVFSSYNLPASTAIFMLISPHPGQPAFHALLMWIHLSLASSSLTPPFLLFILTLSPLHSQSRCRVPLANCFTVLMPVFIMYGKPQNHIHLRWILKQTSTCKFQKISW